MARLEQLLLIASQNLAVGNLEEAIRNNNLALVLDSNNAFALHSLALTYFIKREFQQTERYCQLALAINSENTTVRNILAEAYFIQNRFYDAYQEQCKILVRTPQNIRGRVGLGHSYIGMKQYDDAIREYSTVIKQGLKATVNLGWTHLFSNKKYDRAIQVQQRIMEKCDIVQAYHGLIKAHLQKEEYFSSFRYTFQLTLFEWKTRIVDLICSLNP